MTTPQDRLAAAHASWNAGDLDGYLELYDDAIRLHGYSPEPMGKPEVARVLRGDLRRLRLAPARLPRGAVGRRRVHDPLHDDRPPRRRVHGRAGHRADIALPGITILHFEGDRSIERFSQADMLGLMVQMGAIPAPA